MSELRHAGCVARQGRGIWSGVLLTGPSGVGKSDLMLRLVQAGWSLVADDRVHLWPSEGRLYARPPEPLAGLMEVRGLDVRAGRHRAFAAIDLLVQCVAAGGELDRIPPRCWRTELGVRVESVTLRPLEPSAPLKTAMALARALDRW